jgi:hypothetical protein
MGQAWARRTCCWGCECLRACSSRSSAPNISIRIDQGLALLMRGLGPAGAAPDAPR